MRKIITDYGELGHPFNVQDYEHLQKGFQEVISAIMQSIATNPSDIIILTGCSVTTNSTNTFTTAGWIYYNGEIFQVNAHNIVGTNVNSLNWYVDRTGFDPLYVTYGDASQKQVHSIPVLKMIYGSGDFTNSSLVYYDIKNAFIAKQRRGAPDSNGFYSPNTFTEPGLYKIEYSNINRNSIPNPYTAEWPNLTSFVLNYDTARSLITKFFGNIKITSTNFSLNSNFIYPPNFTSDIQTFEQELSLFSIMYTGDYITNGFQLENTNTYGGSGTVLDNSESPFNAANNATFIPITFKRYYVPFSEAQLGSGSTDNNYYMVWTEWKKIY